MWPILLGIFLGVFLIVLYSNVHQYRKIKATLVALYNKFTSRDTLQVSHYEKYMILEYRDNGSQEKIYVPTDMTQSFYASQCRVYVGYANGKEELISQCEKVPLMITANMLGAKYIRVNNVYMDTEKTYHGDEIPDYY